MLIDPSLNLGQDILFIAIEKVEYAREKCYFKVTVQLLVYRLETLAK